MFRKIALAASIAAFGAILSADQDYTGFAKSLSGDQKILQALNRLTFGPRPGDVEAVKKMGLTNWIDLQLHPERIAENPALESQANAYAEPAPARFLTPAQQRLLRTGPVDQAVAFLTSLPPNKAAQVLETMPAVRARLASKLPPPLRAKLRSSTGGGDEMALRRLISPQQIAMLRTGSNEDAVAFLASLPQETAVQVLAQMPAVRKRLLPMLDADLSAKVEAAAPGPPKPGDSLAEAKLLRASESNRQLEEVLVDFWFNHFNIDASKGADRFLISQYERDAIRPHVLGKFRDLLEATATSPAMMFYLDNWQSKAGALNENYARELMELHTLGVDGGYTQKDVTEIARCFTGWTIDQPRMGGPFVYRDRVHDHDQKIVLGVNIPAGGGRADGEKVLDMLARRPATARFISRELAQRFVADDPPAAFIDRMAKTFQSTDGDIRAVLSTMFNSPEFFSEGAYRSKIKSPFEMAVSALRATGATLDQPLPLVVQIANLGEPLYRKQEPTGYPNASQDWMSSSGLMGRMNLAMDLASDKLPGVSVDTSRFAPVPAESAHSILFADASKGTLDAIGTQADPQTVAGMLLGSPDFQRK